VDKPAGYGRRRTKVDGTDLSACLSVLEEAVRSGKGAVADRNFIVAHLLRLCGHGEHDDASYVDGK